MDNDFNFQDTIARAHRNLQEELETIRREIEALREMCKHPRAVAKYESDTGHLSRSDDWYGVNCSCPDCGKHWMVFEHEDREGYKYWGKFVK